MEAMRAALRFVLIWGGFLAVILIPIWPVLALAAGTWSEGMGSLIPGILLKPYRKQVQASGVCHVFTTADNLSLEWSRLPHLWVAAAASELCHKHFTLQFVAICMMPSGSVLLYSSANAHWVCGMRKV